MPSKLTIELDPAEKIRPRRRERFHFLVMLVEHVLHASEHTPMAQEPVARSEIDARKRMIVDLCERIARQRSQITPWAFMQQVKRKIQAANGPRNGLGRVRFPGPAQKRRAFVVFSMLQRSRAAQRELLDRPKLGVQLHAPSGGFAQVFEFERRVEVDQVLELIVEPSPAQRNALLPEILFDPRVVGEILLGS